MRIGVDLGGTKIEALAIDARGAELSRHRVPTPPGPYAETIEAIRALVFGMESRLGGKARVGVGTPGAVSPATGLVKNANSTRLNGCAIVHDLSQALGREVRVANDANCFALSEAVDGAAAGHRAVFGAILGTGVGGGLVIDRAPWVGPNAIAGEWGHAEMPSRIEHELPDLACYCGRRRCIEAYVSGPALAADHARRAPGSPARDARAVAALAASGDADAVATMARHANRVAGGLSIVLDIVDPDIVVLGGGLSSIDGLAEAVAARLPAHVFSDRVDTPVVCNRHGDSSGVRGAAWLWPAV